jgi:hypothetical protein
MKVMLEGLKKVVLRPGAVTTNWRRKRVKLKTQGVQ